MWDQYYLNIWCCKGCTWKRKSRKSIGTNMSERKGHSEKLGYSNFQMESPPPIAMHIFLVSERNEIRKELWNASGKGISFSCYSLVRDLYWKINWDPACSCSHCAVGTAISTKSLVIFFSSQSCLYLTHSRAVNGTGNSTRVQISPMELPGEARKGRWGLAGKIKTTDSIET